MIRPLIVRALLLTLLAIRGQGIAGTIPVPNASFELPTANFVSIDIESWQKTPKPADYDESGGFLWTQLTGIFENPSVASPDHIVNCHGLQAIWLFAVPEVGLFQDYDSVDLQDPAPTHDFDVRFEAGRSYHLTVGVIGTGGGMLSGATLELSLYYRDANSNRIPVAATMVTNLPTVFSNNTQLVDFTVNLPTVQTNDPWAGEHVGISLLSTVSTNLQRGYWDLDNVRLETGPELRSPQRLANQTSFTVFGQPGAVFEILGSTNPVLPVATWTGLGWVTNLTGSTPFVDTNAGFGQRFYQARQLP